MTKKIRINEVRRMWDLNLIDGYTRAEHELKEVGVKATHKRKMALAKWLGLPSREKLIEL